MHPVGLCPVVGVFLCHYEILISGYLSPLLIRQLKEQKSGSRILSVDIKNFDHRPWKHLE